MERGSGPVTSNLGQGQTERLDAVPLMITLEGLREEANNPALPEP